MGNAAGAFDLCCAKGPEKSAGDAEIVKALTAAKRLTEIRHSFLRYGCMLTIVFRSRRARIASLLHSFALPRALFRMEERAS